MKRSKDRFPSIVKAVAVISLFSFIYAGCSDNSTSSDPPSDESEFNLQVISTSSDGEVLTDSEGNVLYFFTPDAEGESECEGGCLDSWPVFGVDSLMLDDELNADHIGNIHRPEGSLQITYKGWPLYYFSGDSQPEEVSGDEIDSFGGIWYVAKSSHTIMRATQQLVGHDEQNYIVDENGSYLEGQGTTTHFTDGEGKTLYTFINDSANTNTFTNEDFSNNQVWPIFEEELNSIPDGLDELLFGTIDIYGRQQLTYKGWPLYYFGQDEEQRGNTKGISYPEPGVWPVAQQGMTAAPGFESDNSNNGDDVGDDNGDDSNDDNQY